MPKSTNPNYVIIFFIVNIVKYNFLNMKCTFLVLLKFIKRARLKQQVGRFWSADRMFDTSLGYPVITLCGRFPSLTAL